MINRNFGRGYITLHPLVPWMDLDRPLRWPQIFGNSSEIAVEIGFGLGDYLVRQAQACPEKNFVGIETGWIPVKRTLRKIGLARVPNIRLVRVQASVALERLFEERSIHSVSCLFPCPWPKKRHVKNRLFSHDFLLLLNSRLQESGEAFMVTDDRGFLDWVLQQVSGCGFEAVTGCVSRQFRTKYERKWALQGQERFHSLHLKKRAHIPMALKEDVRLITYRVENFHPSSFHPQRCYGNPAVEFKEVLFDPDREKAMIRCVAGEDSLVQNFWVEIVRETSLWHIRPAKGCSLMPTRGVQKALDVIYDAVKAARFR